MEFIICLVIVAAILGFLYWRLVKSNMEIPPNAEKRLPEREAIRFAIDNNIMIR